MNVAQEHTTELEKTDEQVALIRRLGTPLSTIILDTPCHIFTLPHMDGVVGYRLFDDCAVAIGDPICLPQNRTEFAQAFHSHCQKNNWKIVYFLASDSFAHEEIQNGCQTLIHVADELVLDPTSFQKGNKIRWKVSQSLRHGIVIKEYQNFDSLLETQMKNIINAWLKEKQGPQIYLGNLKLFTNQDNDKRIFYALQKDKIVGLLTLSRIDHFQGWVVNSFLSLDKTLPITEHLMTSAIDILANEDCHFLCLGIASRSKLGEIMGLNVFSKFIAHFIFTISNWLFRLDRRKTYLNKYHPSLGPKYILTSERLGIRELLAIKKTLNVKFSTLYILGL